jgi:hypothetical protein
MPDIETLKAVARATVRLPRKGGQGVLVPGQLILTAAHCIGWTSEGHMALGDAFPETIESGSRKLTVDVLAVEPRSDIAVLGALDDQVYTEEADAFEAWCDETRPVRLYTDNLPVEESTPPSGFPRVEWTRLLPSIEVPAHILTHNKGWIQVRARQMRRDAHIFVVESDELIDGGTSGGPVIADDGRLLGVVSQSGETQADGERKPAGAFPVPRPHLTLPAWIVPAMRA